MTNRVVVGPLPGGGAGIRVSRPGYNALDAGLQPKQVAFDSRWNRAGRVHMTGVVTGDSTVYFGKTFAICPLVYLVFTDAQGRYRNHRIYGGEGLGAIRTYTDRVVFDLVAGFYPATYVVVSI